MYTYAIYIYIYISQIACNSSIDPNKMVGKYTKAGGWGFPGGDII